LISLGGRFDDKDYKGMPLVFVMYIQTWRNSLGDISAPEYAKNNKKIKYDEGKFHDIYSKNHFNSNVTQTLVWCFWLLNQVFSLIILLNFLITIIGKAYEKVMMMVDWNRYHHKCSLNEEISTMLKFKKRDNIPFNCILIISEVDDQKAESSDQNKSTNK